MQSDIQIRTINIKRIVRRINTRLKRDPNLDLGEAIREMAVEYGISPEALGQRIRRRGAVLRKQLELPGE